MVTPEKETQVQLKTMLSVEKLLQGNPGFGEAMRADIEKRRQTMAQVKQEAREELEALDPVSVEQGL